MKSKIHIDGWSYSPTHRAYTIIRL